MKRTKNGEIRLDENGKLDEVVASNVKLFHLERMDSDHVWMRLDFGGNKSITVSLYSPRGGKIMAHAERDL